MKKLILTIALLSSTQSIAGISGLKDYSTEELVGTLLLSEELSQEKEAKGIDLPLSKISFQATGNSATVYLTYSNGGAPCSVKAVVKVQNVTPAGAQGINIRPVVSEIASACAVYGQ